MRILYIGHSAGMLGAERSMSDIACEAVKDGHDVLVVLPSDGPLRVRLEDQGVRVALHPVRAWLGAHHWLPPIGVIRLIQARRAVAGLVEVARGFRPDVVITNTAVIPSGAQAAAALGVPHVWIIRESLKDNPQLRSLLSKRWIARRIVRQSTIVCSVSDYVRQQLVSLAGEEPRRHHIVSPNPASAGMSLDSNPPTVDRTRTILMPGYYSREKGQHLVVLGAWRARKHGNRANIHIIGRGSWLFTNMLAMLIHVLRVDGVELLPWSDDLRGEYERAHFVLTASRNEAFGRTVVEAFSNGRPVIGFARGATTDLLTPGGGILIAESRVAGMARGLVRATGMTDGEYAALRSIASRRGREFANGRSQYAALRSALGTLESVEV